MEDVVAKVEKAKSPITVSGIPIYVARKTCLANCEIAGVDYLLYETATGWEIVSINEDESFTSVLTGTGVMHDMCNYQDSIILAGSTGAWIVEDGALEIIYDSEVMSIQSDGASLWGVVGGKVCQFGGTDGFIEVITEASLLHNKPFYYDGDYYSIGTYTGGSEHIMYKLVGGTWTAVYTDATSRKIIAPVILLGRLFVAISNDVYEWDGTTFDFISTSLHGINYMFSHNGNLLHMTLTAGYLSDITELNITTLVNSLYARIDITPGQVFGSSINDVFILVCTDTSNNKNNIYTIATNTGETIQEPDFILDDPSFGIVWDANRQTRIWTYTKEYIFDEQITEIIQENDRDEQTISAIKSGDIYTFLAYTTGTATVVYSTPTYGTPTPIDDTVRAYSKLRLLADALYCGATDGEVYKVEPSGLTQITSTLSGCYALAWRKDKIYAAGATQVYLVNANGTISEVENATSATTIKELFVSGDYLVWCPTYTTTGTLYAAFVEYTGSVNVWQDITLHIPTDFPIGATKIFRKMSAYSGTPVIIEAVTGSTIEGKASVSLYGQYAFVVLERISATLFALREIEDYYTFTPSLLFGGSAVGMTYSGRTGLVVRKKNETRVSIYVQLSAKGNSTGAPTITGSAIAASTAKECFIENAMVLFTGTLVVILETSGTFTISQRQENGYIGTFDDTKFTNTSRIRATAIFKEA